jgi:hypothetical protein
MFPDSDGSAETRHELPIIVRKVHVIWKLTNKISSVTFVHSHTLHRSLDSPMGSQSHTAGVADGEHLFLCVQPQ